MARRGAVLDLPDETIENGGELVALGVVRRFGRDRHLGPLLAGVDQPDRPEVGVLDRPAVTLDGGDRHAKCGGVALPRHDDRRDVALAPRILLDHAGHDLRRSGGGERDDFAHTCAATAC
jgi:hypothetical protein